MKFNINALRKEWWEDYLINIVDTFPTKLNEECFANPFEIGVVETPNDKMFSYKIGVYLFNIKGKQVFVDANDILEMAPEYENFENYVGALINYLNQHNTLKP